MLAFFKPVIYLLLSSFTQCNLPYFGKFDNIEAISDLSNESHRFKFNGNSIS